MNIKDQVKFANGIKAVVTEVWANNDYVVRPDYPMAIIPFGFSTLVINAASGKAYNVGNDSYTVVDVVPAHKTKAVRKEKKNSNFHAYGSYCPLRKI